MNGGQGVWLLLLDHVSAHQLPCEWLPRNLHKPSQPRCSAWFGDKRVTIMFTFINMKAFLLILSSVLFKFCVYSLVTSCTNTVYLDDLQSLILLPEPFAHLLLNFVSSSSSFQLTLFIFPIIHIPSSSSALPPHPPLSPPLFNLLSSIRDTPLFIEWGHCLLEGGHPNMDNGPEENWPLCPSGHQLPVAL